MGILFFRGRRANKLYDKGRELVEAGKYEDALAIGRKLRKINYSGAFEIEGLAYAGLDRHEDAVRVLREGLALAPTAWANWILLGSCLSDLGRYDEALAAYDRAQACESADVDSIELNRAIVANRRGDFAAALEHLDRVSQYESTAMRLAAVRERIGSLRDLGRTSEAEELGTRTLREWLDRPDPESAREAGNIAFAVAEMRRERLHNPAALLREVVSWWRATREASLLWMIRDLRPIRSPEAKYFQLLLHGLTPHDPEVDGFFTSANVVADSAEEALALYLELDPPEPGVEVTIEKAEAVEPSPEDPKGVYSTRGRTLYVDE